MGTPESFVIHALDHNARHWIVYINGGSEVLKVIVEILIGFKY